MEVAEYLDKQQKSPYADWFDGLDVAAATKVNTAKERMAKGNLSNTKHLEGGVWEKVIDYGPGYRIYFGKDGNTLVVLLGGGTKKRQQEDINAALICWADYKERKK